MKRFAIVIATGALSMSLAAQDTTTKINSNAGTTTQDDRSAGQSMKDAGHDTVNAGKDVGHATATGAKKVGHGTKKVVHKGAQKTEEGANKVEDKTAPQ